MSGETTSANMSLPIPGAGLTGGPTWASDLNACLTLIDSHNHSAGQGVPITPSGLNINSDLTMASNNLIAARSLRMTAQSVVLGGASDLGCLSVVGVDLYYNDLSGNKIQITQSGGIAGSPGSISNLTSPASAAYVAANQTFVWQSAANTPAIMDGASVIVRNQLANGKGVTLSATAALAADYTLTLPPVAASGTKMVTVDTSGNLGSVYDVDNSTLQVSSNLLLVKDLGITQAKMKIFTAASSTATLGNMAISSSSGTFSQYCATVTAIPGLSVIITSNGNPIELWLQHDGSGSNGKIGAIQNGSNTAVSASFSFYRGSTPLTKELFETNGWAAGHGVAVAPDAVVAPSALHFVDVVAAGTYVYSFRAISNNINSDAACTRTVLCAKEMK